MSLDGEDVVKQAYMEKRSIMKKSLFTQENYRKRWFELTRTLLRYYDGTPEVSCTFKFVCCLLFFPELMSIDLLIYIFQSGPIKEKGKILLNQIKAVEKVDNDALKSKNNVFQVSVIY